MWDDVSVWRQNYLERLNAVKLFTKKVASDDPDVAGYRQWAANVITDIMAAWKTTEIADQNGAAIALSGFEVKLGNIGRQLFGVAWRVKMCGYGAIVTTCGYKDAC